MTKKQKAACLVLTPRDLLEMPQPLKNCVVDRLIAAGAPVVVNRSNRFDLSEYNDEEINFTGEMRRWEDFESGAILFGWKQSLPQPAEK